MDALIESLRFLLKQAERDNDPHVSRTAGRHLSDFNELVKREGPEAPEVEEEAPEADPKPE